MTGSRVVAFVLWGVACFMLGTSVVGIASALDDEQLTPTAAASRQHEIDLCENEMGGAAVVRAGAVASRGIVCVPLMGGPEQ